MQEASTAFGVRATEFVSAMPVSELLALPLNGVTRSLIRASAIVHVCSQNDQFSRVSLPALQDLRAVSEAHYRIDLHDAPVIKTLHSMLDMFLDMLALSEPHGLVNGGLSDAAEPNMEVAMHMMEVVQTAEQRRAVYDGAVQITLGSNVAMLAEMTPEMAANAPVVDAIDTAVRVVNERWFISNMYDDVRGRVTTALDSLHGMLLTQYRFRTILNELVLGVLVVLLRGMFDHLAYLYHEGLVTMAGAYELITTLEEQHTGLLDMIITRLQQHCADANVFTKHNHAPVVDDATFDGVQLTARIHSARTMVEAVARGFADGLEEALAAGPMVHHLHALMAPNHAVAAAAAIDITAAVEVVMAQATVVQLLEEEDCAVCTSPSSEMVLCHGCLRCHCCVACTRHIVQTKLHGHCCPICRSRAFPVPL